jgi:hypothetical protein
VGWLGGKISARVRGRGLRVAGVLLALFGVLTIFRGNAVVHHWFHRHTVPAAAGPAEVMEAGAGAGAAGAQ